MLFSDLDLHPILLNALNEMGYQSPTPVQSEVLPIALTGQDLMVSSQTGSGKTAAFLLPVLNILLDLPAEKRPFRPKGERGFGKMKENIKPKALVLCPTRELAQQVAKEAIRLKGMAKGVRISTVVGGMPYGQQIRELENVTILVATPGRLLDLYNQKVINLSEVEFFVADEADRMLDLGFAEDLELIHKACTNCEQNLMFSATFPKNIMRLAEEMMTEPHKIELSSKSILNENITQQINFADDRSHQRELLMHWLRSPSLDQAVVFTPTQIESEEIAELLEDEGFSVTFLHGGIPQKVRNRRLETLRKGRTKILVATDVAARGIDIATVTHVINIGLPMKAEDYVHRIGRTGRAGRKGDAISLVNVRDHKRVRDISDYTSFKIDVSTIEGLEPTLDPNDFRESRNKKGGRSRRGNGGGNGRYGKSSGGARRSDRGGDRERAPRAERENREPRGGEARAEKPKRERKSSSEFFDAPKGDRDSRGAEKKRFKSERSDRPARPAGDRPRAPKAHSRRTRSE
ncbi:DEAD/DEAH box helicase [Wohlfahrtiimonas chitiniclastica]|uniref:DEAD/DEAH box helicase n=2 Tax=Wohlfahrtiimonas chitiniclastica TaxID=400946 RepID=UPI001BCAF98C|nr:DEAD/DEAH box helicase [Wohlfahrtiimonas chitiniclastica]MBS7819560.1 DEAD/DEAH box helicase [Wohlfahrtiimonas chitiniclastica]MBS7827335.1 DEAD/DEAH box helicase [Wohlfahrtiimonas chitiniclastica]